MLSVFTSVLLDLFVLLISTVLRHCFSEKNSYRAKLSHLPFCLRVVLHQFPRQTSVPSLVNRKFRDVGHALWETRQSSSLTVTARCASGFPSTESDTAVQEIKHTYIYHVLVGTSATTKLSLSNLLELAFLNVTIFLAIPVSQTSEKSSTPAWFQKDGRLNDGKMAPGLSTKCESKFPGRYLLQ